MPGRIFTSYVLQVDPVTGAVAVTMTGARRGEPMSEPLGPMWQPAVDRVRARAKKARCSTCGDQCAVDVRLEVPGARVRTYEYRPKRGGCQACRPRPTITFRLVPVAAADQDPDGVPVDLFDMEAPWPAVN